MAQLLSSSVSPLKTPETSLSVGLEFFYTSHLISFQIHFNLIQDWIKNMLNTFVKELHINEIKTSIVYFFQYHNYFHCWVGCIFIIHAYIPPPKRIKLQDISPALMFGTIGREREIETEVLRPRSLLLRCPAPAPVCSGRLPVNNLICCLFVMEPKLENF